MNDGRKNPGIKIPHLSVVDRPIVEGTRCVQVRIPDDDSYMAVLAGLVAIGNQWFNWERDNAHTGALLAQQWRNAYLETEWDACMNCEELTECLQPLFDALEAKIDAVQAQTTSIESIVEAIQEVQNNNSAKQPEPQTNVIANERCGGATALVKEMHRVNMLEYANAEASAVDNIFEMINLIVDNIPLFGELPFTALYDLANAFFENEATTYETDYALIESDIICDLKCFVEINSGVFDIDVWNDWLVYVGATYPGNKAAILFNRYAPVHQTFINQIAALINKDASLQSYFDTLAQQWYAGTQNPLDCSGCDDCEWCVSFTGTVLQSEFFPAGGLGPQAIWTGTGYARNDAVAPSRITIAVDLLASVNVTSIRVINSVAITGGTDNIKNILSYPAYATMASEPGTADTLFSFGTGTPVQTFAIDCITDIVGYTPVPGEIIEVVVTGTGIAPATGTPC